MFNSAKSLIHSLTIVCATAVLSLPASAQNPPVDAMMQDMSKQLGKFSGAMHATAKVCGDYSAEQLAEMKQEQKTQLTQSGMNANTFDQAFAEGEREGAEKWSTLPAAEQKATCEKIKRQIAEATQQVGG